jgi:glyceraldehyde 3-phosphate dehydrogenase
MSARIGINGFGRMGWLGLRAGWGRAGLAFDRINEIATDAAGSAHLLKFDSVHGTWPQDTSAEAGRLVIGDQSLTYTSITNIEATQVKVYAWYDNEWGYVNRLMDLAQKVAAGL